LADEYRVLQAADGNAALEMVQRRRPNLVLLDLMLPGLDGLDVCRAIKSDEDTKGTRVVLLTARTDEEAKIAALERGADDFLVKPFSTVEVKKRLANLLRAAQLEEDLKTQNTELEVTLAHLKETEAQLVQSEKMNALGNLAAGLLHEINNPLNFTLTALQLAQQDVPEDNGDLRETLQDIGQGMDRIRDIVSDLRAFAYPSSETKGGRFSLSECLDTSLKLVSHELDGIALRREIPEDVAVAGTKTQIAHVLLNLVANAAEAARTVAGERNPEIRVSAEPNGQRVTVRVWDNGVGIAPANLPKIFNPFFTTKDVGKGMGLGLSICHTIVKNHGGEIRAESEVNQWTEMAFDLPLAQAET
jgi:signal transduction histidine kinase